MPGHLSDTSSVLVQPVEFENMESLWHACERQPESSSCIPRPGQKTWAWPWGTMLCSRSQAAGGGVCSLHRVTLMVNTILFQGRAK